MQNNSTDSSSEDMYEQTFAGTFASHQNFIEISKPYLGPR